MPAAAFKCARAAICLPLTVPLMASYWSKVCNDQYNRPPMQLRLANYGGCIFAASHLVIQVSEVVALLRCAVAWMVQRDSVCRQHWGCHGLGLVHAEQCSVL